MQLQTIPVKDRAAITLEGVKIDQEWIGDSLSRVTLTDAKGKTLVFAKHGWSDFVAMQTKPPKLVSRFHVHADHGGIKVSRYFEHENHAKDYAKDLSVHLPQIQLKQDTVEIDEETANTLPATNPNELPF